MTATFAVGSASTHGGLDYAHYLGSDELELDTSISPALAERLGIDRSRQPTDKEFANLMNIRTGQGFDIQGRKRHSPHQSIAEVFDLPTKRKPNEQEIDRVLAGRRTDGLPADVSRRRLDSAVRQFRASLGQKDYFHRINATGRPIGWLDLTFSPDKTVSLAYAFEPNPDQRLLLLRVVRDASLDTLQTVYAALGKARDGQQADMACISVPHYTARPVGGNRPDPQLHRHNIILSTMLTRDGRARAFNLDRLLGRIKEFGRTFQRAIADRFRQIGLVIELGLDGIARIPGMPHWVADMHSKRARQGLERAEGLAATSGRRLDDMAASERARLVSVGVRKAREDKTRLRGEDGRSLIGDWQREADRAGYRHRSAFEREGLGR